MVTTIQVSAQPAVEDKIRAAMGMDYRSKAEVARDANRDPVAALSFMGFSDDMKVIEFLPASAWYTKILAPVLADRGELILLDSKGTFDRWGDLLEHQAFRSARAMPIENNFSRSEGRYVLGELDLGVSDDRAIPMRFLVLRFGHELRVVDKEAQIDLASLRRVDVNIQLPRIVGGVVIETQWGAVLRALDLEDPLDDTVFAVLGEDAPLGGLEVDHDRSIVFVTDRHTSQQQGDHAQDQCAQKGGATDLESAHSAMVRP